jgi:hypothetical protein
LLQSSGASGDIKHLSSVVSRGAVVPPARHHLLTIILAAVSFFHFVDFSLCCSLLGPAATHQASEFCGFSRCCCAGFSHGTRAMIAGQAQHKPTQLGSAWLGLLHNMA